MRGGRRTALAGAALLAVLAACGDATDPAVRERPDPRLTAAPRPPDRSPDVPTQRAPRPATAADRALARAFVAFAAHPAPTTVAAVRLAPNVRIGLGESLFRSVARADATGRGAWRLEVGAYRAHSGPFDALRLLRRHVQRHGAGSLRVVVGPHPHCASPPVPAPQSLRSTRRISLQPRPPTVSSCLEWFTVDLFLGDGGSVAGVTLDVWEP
jgi:hypothetical protein